MFSGTRVLFVPNHTVTCLALGWGLIRRYAVCHIPCCTSLSLCLDPGFVEEWFIKRKGDDSQLVNYIAKLRLHISWSFYLFPLPFSSPSINPVSKHNHEYLFANYGFMTGYPHCWTSWYDNIQVASMPMPEIYENKMVRMSYLLNVCKTEAVSSRNNPFGVAID